MLGSGDLIYLDANATTHMPDEVVAEMIKWINCGNPSAGYKTAAAGRARMTAMRKYIAKLCGISPCCIEPRDGGGPSDPVRIVRNEYRLIFTSGASESNCTFVRAVVDAYRESRGAPPHVVCSAIEHKSILSQVEDYAERGIIELTLVAPMRTGHILPTDILTALRPNTVLAICMHANNETGAVNDVVEMGRLCHTRNVVFFTDCVQSFGKFPPRPYPHIDAFSASFHKLHGPPGVGLLAVKSELWEGFRLRPTVYGTQNLGMRGGTENLPALMAAQAALTITMTDRLGKNRALQRMRRIVLERLKATKIPIMTYAAYGDESPDICIVCFSGISGDYLPNTLLISLVKKTKPYVCNVEMKNQLEAEGIIVSVGSACNTASAKASHVLYALGADEFIRKGTLRISFDDCNTALEAESFAETFVKIIRHQLMKR